MSKGMPFAKSLPQGDNTASRRVVPKTGPDDSPKHKIANGSATAPRLPDRDGPAKGKVGGVDAGKPKTSAKAAVSKRTKASMVASLRGLK
jgi:hypothetical protein